MIANENDAIHMVEFCVATGLNLATIVVLAFTWRAAVKQAKAAERLTDATDQQIKMSAEQAAAAREQVHVARRQITESLRTILIFSVTDDRGIGKVRSEGGGVALDAWFA